MSTTHDLTLGQLDAATIHRFAVDREPFEIGRLSGHVGTISGDRLGRARRYLEEETRRDRGVRWVDWYRQDFGAIAYTVLSFDLPIAWLADRYWVVASHFVSQPTKRHQAGGARPGVSARALTQRPHGQGRGPWRPRRQATRSSASDRSSGCSAARCTR
jgi:hypothetical protein